ncbi:hypothetical protein [Paenibacillus spongiae]|uniref:FTP domain-containing protein n=1 Tax=Paenibacillus spongiae TaxID=2909671 RepID=A0ABY5S128_9BACL|nr:hypothetical protein [Paenibacillus spongiae]UVI27556.1 hypothetical protein L1F29_18990 [Paenibacillus spongiae]
MRMLIKTILMAAVIALLSHQGAYAADIPPKARASLRSLIKESHDPVEIYWNETTNTPAILTGELSRPSMHTPEWIAYKYLNKTKVLYGLRFPNRDMKIMGVDRSNPGFVQVKLQHMLFQTPVWGDSITIDIDEDGVIRRVQGRVHADMEKKLFYRRKHASIPIKKAAAIARDALRHDPDAAGPLSLQAYYLPTRPGTPLIYAATVRNRQTGVETNLFIHAITGHVIKPHS